jgi:sec-independent protein translocase protein TatA
MSFLVLAIFGLPGGMEWIIIGLAALLLFGRRLPDVARSMGKSIVEFKKGLRDIKDEVDHATDKDQPILPPDDRKGDEHASK